MRRRVASSPGLPFGGDLFNPVVPAYEDRLGLPVGERKRLWVEWMGAYYEPWRAVLHEYEESHGTVTWEWLGWRPPLEVPAAPFDPGDV